MLNLDPIEQKETYRSAVLSAELLRQCGEVAKAARLESLARSLAREIETAKSSARSLRGDSRNRPPSGT
jgi:hypothetical protein